jgi:hypothetical protein
MPADGSNRGEYRAKPTGRPKNVSVGLIVAAVFAAAILAATVGLGHGPGASSPHGQANAVGVPG